MKDMTDSNKRVLEQEQQDYTEPSYTDLMFANNGRGILDNK
jgi:hypothetical protein